MTYDLIVIGGGAAGFYGAIQTALHQPTFKILILEKNNTILNKVKISGGGRCNVTHAAFESKQLASNYPRGHVELLGPFHTSAVNEVVDFFQKRNITLKTEADGRMFPETNSSQTIIDCFLSETQQLKIQILKQQPVIKLENQSETGRWVVSTTTSEFKAKKILVTTGSSPKFWTLLATLGLQMVPPVPSLFSFNIEDKSLHTLSGTSTKVAVQLKTISYQNNIKEKNLHSEEGNLLITHWGMSGPVILKSSAWAARNLFDVNYKFALVVNWMPDFHSQSVLEYLQEIKVVEAKKSPKNTKIADLPKNLWRYLLKKVGVPEKVKWGDLGKSHIQEMARILTLDNYLVNGKSTYKDEFVTAGGVHLSEINFKTFESKKFKGLYLAGEVLDIDAVTGGFNFQNAWTGAHIAAKSITNPDI